MGAQPAWPTSGVTSGQTPGALPNWYALNQLLRQFDTTLGVGAGTVVIGDGTTLDNRALLSTDNPGMVINAQTGTSYTLTLTDPGKFIERNNAAANTITVPANSSVAIPVGSVIPFGQLGAGITTITWASPVNVRAFNGLVSTAGQYAVGTLHKRATDEWWLYGQMA